MEEYDDSASETSEWSDELSKLQDLLKLKNLSEKERSEISELVSELMKAIERSEGSELASERANKLLDEIFADKMSSADIDQSSIESSVQYGKMEPSEKDITRLNRLFVKNNDPFSIKNNLPHNVAAAYFATRKISIDTIVDYIVTHPVHAQAFLQKHKGVSLPPLRNFRKELAQRPDLLLFLYETAQRNKALNNALGQTHLSHTKHMDIENTAKRLTTTNIPTLSDAIDERRYQILLKRQKRYQAAWERKLAFYERQYENFNGKNFPKITDWLRNKTMELHQRLHRLKLGLQLTDPNRKKFVQQSIQDAFLKKYSSESASEKARSKKDDSSEESVRFFESMEDSKGKAEATKPLKKEVTKEKSAEVASKKTVKEPKDIQGQIDALQKENDALKKAIAAGNQLLRAIDARKAAEKEAKQSQQRLNDLKTPKTIKESMQGMGKNPVAYTFKKTK